MAAVVVSSSSALRLKGIPICGSTLRRSVDCLPSVSLPVRSKFSSESHQWKSSLSGTSLWVNTQSKLRFARRHTSGPLTTMATIKVGDKLPEGTLNYKNSDGVQSISVKELTEGKKVVLFAVPGAFTPTCSLKHLPGFVEKADELKAKGVATIACVSVNDPFVMEAWGSSVGVGDKVLLLADGSGIFTEKIGVALDLKDKGLGIRSRRYSMLVDDGVVKVLNLEEGGAFTNSGAEDILKSL
eukprot:TRINITY_DN1468_c0_g1_i1.p1 TRINITY_DN1468_c0_g1~~TRINITY_DN1468_c0_g1_i1.p1  ORF type:complete len:241 (-),score=52.33 TRINITY_DN1468_c0_g1_i1:336-1058(-)